MGSDGIFDQMSSGEIIDCAWMILNNNKNNVYLKKFDEYKTNDEEEIENTEYNFENFNIHEKCGLIVDLILKASMLRKSFDNVTCLMIALTDFINIEDSTEIDLNKNGRNNYIKQVITKSKKPTQIINKKKW